MSMNNEKMPESCSGSSQNKSLMDRLLEAGYPSDKMFSHCADLYILVNDISVNVVNEWLHDNNFTANKFLIDTFIDVKTGKIMYDIAFQYLPWWEQKSMLKFKESGNDSDFRKMRLN